MGAPELDCSQCCARLGGVLARAASCRSSSALSNRPLRRTEVARLAAAAGRRRLLLGCASRPAALRRAVGAAGTRCRRGSAAETCCLDASSSTSAGVRSYRHGYYHEAGRAGDQRLPLDSYEGHPASARAAPIYVRWVTRAEVTDENAYPMPAARPERPGAGAEGAK